MAGALSNEGRVEICNQNQWGSVCDMGWGVPDARVACYHAGYSGDASSEAITIIVCYIIIVGNLHVHKFREAPVKLFSAKF